MFRAATTLMRIARQTTTTTVPKRRFGAHGGDHHGDHHHHAPLDSSYKAEYYARFKLPPIPKDGVYRRPGVDGNAYGPWNTNADAFSQDYTDMVPLFSRHGPPSLNPYTALKHACIGLSLVWGPIYFAHNYIGDDYTYKTIEEVHPGPLPHLVSSPHAPARQLVVEML